MIIVDYPRMAEVIKTRQPRSVAINGPEALFPKLQEAADRISEDFSIEAYVIGDACWGSCDLNTHAADMLCADILFNVGHTITMENMGSKVVMINAFDDISFDAVAEKWAKEFSGIYRSVCLLTDSQHLNRIASVKNLLIKYGFQVTLGRGKGQLNDGQVFGCEFYPAFNSRDSVDAYVFMGQSNFHAAGVAMATGKPTFMLDPYFEEHSTVNELAQTLQKRAILSIYKALDARKIGIIIGLKEGQFSHVRALEIKKELEKVGRRVQLIAMTEITDDRIQAFKGIDAFVQIACPRLGTDNHFSKPMLSVPQAFALIKLAKGEPVEEFLHVHHWL